MEVKNENTLYNASIPRKHVKGQLHTHKGNLTSILTQGKKRVGGRMSPQKRDLYKREKAGENKT